MQSLMQEDIKELLTVTYTSLSQTSIAQASQRLLQYMINCAPKSYQVIESMLADETVEHSTKQAAANLVKVSGMTIARELKEIKKANEEAFAANKNLLHTVEHIFDNKAIEGQYKRPAGEVYVALYALYKFDNPQRLISKCRYYYNTRNDELAICLIEEYHHTRIPLKFKIQFYEEELIITLEALQRVISEISDFDSLQEGLKERGSLFTKLVTLVEDIMATTTFEKYETIMTKVLKSDQFQGVINNLTQHPLYSAVKESVAVIAGTVVQSLGRCGLFSVFEDIIYPIKCLAVEQFKQLFFESEPFACREIGQATLSFLTNCVKYHLIECNLTPGELYSRFLHSNFLLAQQYLSQQISSRSEIWNYLSDLTYNQSSELPSVQHHKLLLTICRESQPTLTSLRNIVQHFLFVHLPSLSDPDSKVSLPVSEEVRELIAVLTQHISLEKVTLCILHHTSTLLLLFISDRAFLGRLNSLVCTHFTPLLSGNPELAFQTMLLYHSYQEDIFNSDQAEDIKHSIAQAATAGQPLLAEFCQHIIAEQIRQRPPFQEVAGTFETVRLAMEEHYSWEFVPIIEEVFRGYGDTLEAQQVSKLCQMSFNIWKEEMLARGRLGNTVPLLSLLTSMFHIEALSPNFEALIGEVCQIVTACKHTIGPFAEDVLVFLGKGVSALAALPSHVLPAVMVMQQQYNFGSNPIMVAFNELIPHLATNPGFVQWAVAELTREKLNPHSTLLLHSLVYYGHQFLTSESIVGLISHVYLALMPDTDKFNYTNGKLTLILLLLMRHRHEATHDLLANHNWHTIRQRAREQSAVSDRLARQQNAVGNGPFIDEVYQLVYGNDNVYRWRYEVETFLVVAMQLFAQHLQHPMQFKFANLAFAAIVANLLRAEDFIQEDYPDSGSESDESLHPLTPIQREYRADRAIVRAYVPPQEYREADYFEMFQKMACEMGRDEGAKEWANEIVRKVVRADKKEAYDNVLRMRRNNHQKFRLIRRVRRQHQEDDD